ncbi:MAG TPA: nicotinate (nicotinamide) nucleotide adenylyltransferase [Solirubrobacteraceae bacterium]|nr:nicotinate (nicotinamide) nucleotide adenylyltransferase [Solirubrobacteraceae bacterium]
MSRQAGAAAERSKIRPRSLGILGGTFNPPHRGHLALARHARAELGLELVALVPAYAAPHKSDGEGGGEGARVDGGQAGGRDPGPTHRLRMCQLLLDGEQGLSACAIELERGGVSYTVDTLTSLHASHPQAELTLILGADTAATLRSWREPTRLLELAALAIAAREGVPRQPMLDALASLGAVERVSFLDMPAIDVSSSLVRQRAAGGESIEELVGAPVARYIAEHHLYRVPAPAGGR